MGLHWRARRDGNCNAKNQSAPVAVGRGDDAASYSHAALADVQPDARSNAEAAAEAEGHRQPAGPGGNAALAARQCSRQCSRRMISPIFAFDTWNSREMSSK